MKAVAFCPGHITGFFQICEHQDALRSGSRGAGICLSLGATSEVTVREGKGRIEISINGEGSEGKVTRDAFLLLLQRRELNIEVNTTLDLPVSQGFGMSAAGSLSASLALAHLLELPAEKALQATHVAEVTNHTGLGDVAAISRGGVAFRKREGIPPYGEVDRVANELELVAAAVGPSLKTSNILRDEEKKRKINQAGKECYHRLSLCPSLGNFVSLSRDFSKAIGIVPPRVECLVQRVEKYGPASVAMLGNSIFAVGKLEEQAEILSECGKVFRMSTDTRGPRLVAGNHL